MKGTIASLMANLIQLGMIRLSTLRWAKKRKEKNEYHYNLLWPAADITNNKPEIPEARSYTYTESVRDFALATLLL